ncbi:hypothetical protein JL721_12757 [Aureococcus anophagefferens]|nr:hypothetical protein JL721_12757 [Aureococcus anophagefferens]
MSQTPRSASASRRRAADDELGGEDELRGAANHSARRGARRRPDTGTDEEAPRSMFSKMKKHDPLLICLEIAALQCLYYALLGAYFICCHLLYGLPLSMDRFFSTGQKFDFETTSAGLEVLGVPAGASLALDIPSPGN